MNNQLFIKNEYEFSKRSRKIVETFDGTALNNKFAHVSQEIELFL